MGNQPWPQFHNGIRERSINPKSAGKLVVLVGSANRLLQQQKITCRNLPLSRQENSLEKIFYLYEGSYLLSWIFKSVDIHNVAQRRFGQNMIFWKICESTNCYSTAKLAHFQWSWY